MKIVSLIENTSKCGFSPRHGLSLYIESEGRKILFDLGPDYAALKENAYMAGVELSSVDTVVISHGHYDHGGALAGFLEENSNAKIYVHQRAFEPHYNITNTPKKYIGLAPSLLDCGRITLTDDTYDISPDIKLFTVPGPVKCFSPANLVLQTETGPDDFAHEQNMILSEKGKHVLFCGCGHRGIVNIMERAASYKPVICIGGFHLTNPTNGCPVPTALLDEIAEELKGFCGTTFYTCHCTGEEVFAYLHGKMPNIRYFSCGQSLEI